MRGPAGCIAASILIATIGYAPPCHARVALVVLNADPSLKRTLDAHQQGFAVHYQDIAASATYGVAYKLHGVMSAVCEPSTDYVAVVDLAPAAHTDSAAPLTMRVAGPAPCVPRITTPSANGSDRLSMALASQQDWDLVLRQLEHQVPTQTQLRKMLIISVVMNLLVEKSGTGTCYPGHALASGLPQGMMNKLDQPAKDLAKLPLTLCFTIAGDPIGSFGDAILVHNGLDRALAQALTSIAGIRPELAGRVARVFVMETVGLGPHVQSNSHEVFSGPWRVNCTVQRLHGARRVKKGLTGRAAVSCISSNGSQTVHSKMTVGPSQEMNCSLHHIADAQSIYRADGGILAFGIESTSGKGQDITISGLSAARLSAHGKVHMSRLGAGAPPSTTYVAASYARGDGEAATVIDIEMRYLPGPGNGACLFWFETTRRHDITLKPGQHPAVCQLQALASTGVSAYRTDCSCDRMRDSFHIIARPQ